MGMKSGLKTLQVQEVENFLCLLLGFFLCFRQQDKGDYLLCLDS